MFLGAERPLRRLLVTSPGPREGKTTATSNIGIVLAQSGLRVLLIDADMRRPRLHETFGVSTAIGLSSVLMGESTPAGAIQTTPLENLSIMSSKPIPPNPTELMHTERFKQVMVELEGMFDCLVFDSPPVTPVTDATLLSRSVDGVVLIVRANKTRRENLHRTLDSLRTVRANIFGVVLNDLDVTRRQYGYYGSTYYYRKANTYYGDDVEEV
jgi:capsular exopolysaccharide synthesis family protein